MDYVISHGFHSNNLIFCFLSCILLPGEQKKTEEPGNEVDAPIDISSDMMGSLEISSLYDSKFVIFKLPSNC